MKNLTPGGSCLHGIISPIQSQHKKTIKYSFVCWRCGASKHLLTIHAPGGPLRVCRECAKGMGE